MYLNLLKKTHICLFFGRLSWLIAIFNERKLYCLLVMHSWEHGSFMYVYSVVRNVVCCTNWQREVSAAERLERKVDGRALECGR